MPYTDRLITYIMRHCPLSHTSNALESHSDVRKLINCFGSGQLSDRISRAIDLFAWRLMFIYMQLLFNLNNVLAWTLHVILWRPTKGLHLLQSDGCQVLISQKKLPDNEFAHSSAISVVTARLHVQESVLSYTKRRL